MVYCLADAQVDLQLMGDHQLDNAATAVAAARCLQQDGFPDISADSIVKGLSAATLPGRFQVPDLSLATFSTHTF